MDRSWVKLNRTSIEYEEGVNKFIQHANQATGINNHILCPCRECCCRFHKSLVLVYEHLIVMDMEPRYMTASWIPHGDVVVDAATESSSTVVEQDVNEMNHLLQDLFGNQDEVVADASPTNDLERSEGRPLDAERFYRLVADAQRPLYPGCTKYKKLEFIITLYQLKAISGWSDNSFSSLLDILRNVLPEGETLPSSFYHTKKMIGELGLSYQKIDACRNDCMLYWRENENAVSCATCGASRWKDHDSKIPFKVFRYFPLTPRLQRFYMSNHTAELMRWHDIFRTKDGVLRHPADSAAWASLDQRDPQFSYESRNVRLGLASDGFNPFGQLSSAHSTWPVIIAIYNLPPWMCMKQPYLLMSSLIPGPKAPGNDIDIYLQPLVEELKMLWDTGVRTYDVSLKQTFTMRAALMWTINDFPA